MDEPVSRQPPTAHPFAELLQRWRQQVDLTQEKLAERSGVSERTIRNIEGGRTTPRPATMLTLANALPLTPADRTRFEALIGRRPSDELGAVPSTGSDKPRDGLLHPEYQPLSTATRPRQLPANIRGFTGRVAEMERLTSFVADHGSRIVVIEGTAGVGKTALAVRFAHEVEERFPDGVVFINLRGFGPSDVVDSGAALSTLLQAAGISGAKIPVDVQARSAMWRDWTTGRRMIVMLDNARGTDHLRPLLPGEGCLTLVTSRTRMSGLAAFDGADRVSLGRLTADDALALLDTVIGPDRLSGDLDARRQFTEVCARLPLAIRILGERAKLDPDTAVGDLIAEVERDRDPLSSFDLDDGGQTDLRGVFEQSYRALDEPTARVFRLLATHPGTDFGIPGVAAIADVSVREARSTVDRLLAAHLVEHADSRRFQLHDLLRAYAIDLAKRVPDEVADAERRLFDWYLHTMYNANLRIARLRTLETIPPVPADIQPLEFTSHQQALDWCDSEHANVVTLIDAAVHRRDKYAWHLGWVTCSYLKIRGRIDQWIVVAETALGACRLLRDEFGETRMLSSLGVAHHHLGDYDRAISLDEQALAVCLRAGWSGLGAVIAANLSIAHTVAGRPETGDRFAQQAIDLAADAGGRKSVAIAYRALTKADIGLGRFHAGLEHMRQALACLEGIDVPEFRAQMTCELARIHRELGQYQESATAYEQSLCIYREFGFAYGQAITHTEVAELELHRDDPHAAREHYKRALAIYVRLRSHEADAIRRSLAELDRNAPDTSPT